jgi:hypothetical protein
LNQSEVTAILKRTATHLYMNVMETADAWLVEHAAVWVAQSGMVVGHELVIGHADGCTKSNFILKSTKALTLRSFRVRSLGTHNVMHVRVLNVEHPVPT